jgi:transcriptional regulator with XRE-family HTH domain
VVIKLPQNKGGDESMFGEFVKKERLKRDLGLREFCRALTFDASNWSKIERGILPPPQDEGRLKEIANLLGIDEKSEKWQELKDTANIDAGIIPKDFLSDGEVLKSLPLFFRTIRSEKPTAEELDRLIRKIREAS